MIRRFKSFGVALAAVFALTAVVASGAQAVQFHSESSTTFLLGQQATRNVFDTAAGTVKCGTAASNAQFTGEITGTTVSELTITPECTGATAFGQNMIFNFTGCDYLFTAPTGSAPTYDGRFDIQCPEGKHIDVEVPAGECSLTVFPQEVPGVVNYTNGGAGSTRDVLVTSGLEGVAYTVDGPGTICGSVGAHTDGKLTGSVTFKGFENAAHTEQKGLWVE
jgi:hypothetical protein